MPAIDPIELTLEVSAPPDLAWAFLTEPERVAAWFAEASPIAGIGEPYRLDFGEGSVVEGRVLELDPGRSFAHGWAWIGDAPAQETRVRWTVDPLQTGGSRIRLRHDGWTEVGADEAIRDDHEAYWSGYLDDLADLLEEAVGS